MIGIVRQLELGGDTRAMLILLSDVTNVPNYMNRHGFDKIQMCYIL